MHQNTYVIKEILATKGGIYLVDGMMGGRPKSILTAKVTQQLCTTPSWSRCD